MHPRGFYFAREKKMLRVAFGDSMRGIAIELELH